MRSMSETTAYLTFDNEVNRHLSTIEGKRNPTLGINAYRQKHECGNVHLLSHHSDRKLRGMYRGRHPDGSIKIGRRGDINRSASGYEKFSMRIKAASDTSARFLRLCFVSGLTESWWIWCAAGREASDWIGKFISGLNSFMDRFGNVRPVLLYLMSFALSIDGLKCGEYQMRL